jgi:hypothetical protein
VHCKCACQAPVGGPATRAPQLHPLDVGQRRHEQVDFMRRWRLVTPRHLGSRKESVGRQMGDAQPAQLRQRLPERLPVNLGVQNDEVLMPVCQGDVKGLQAREGAQGGAHCALAPGRKGEAGQPCQC